MAGRADNGLELDLDRVPRRAKAMTPYEILLSESQERMLLVAKPGQGGARPRDLREVGARRRGHRQGHRHGALGRPGHARLRSARRRARRTRAPGRRLRSPDRRPHRRRARATIARARRASSPARLAFDPAAIPDPARPRATTLLDARAARPTSARARWVWRQYDHIVRGGTRRAPRLATPASCACPCERDGDDDREAPRLRASTATGASASSTRSQGAAMAVAEVCRNLVCTRRRADRAHRLPELRQPGAARDHAPVRARDRRHRRRVQRARRARS